MTVSPRSSSGPATSSARGTAAATRDTLPRLPAKVAFAQLLAKPWRPPLPSVPAPSRPRPWSQAGGEPEGARNELEHARAHVGPASEPTDDQSPRDRAGDEMLDPAVRQAAMLAPPQAPVVASSAAEEVGAPRARMSLEELMPLLVRRIAWTGDRHRASVRLEIGAGAYSGATLLVHADAGRVRVEVSGAGADELRARLGDRLRRHGLDVESVT